MVLSSSCEGAIEWDPSNNNAGISSLSVCMLVKFVMHIGSLTGLLCRAISDMKHNKSHSLPTVSSEVAMQIGSTLLE